MKNEIELLIIDLETIPCPEGLRKLLPPAQPPSNYKKPEAIERWMEEHGDESFLKTALDGTYGRIVCAGFLAIGCDGASQGTMIYGRNEKEILLQAWEIISAHRSALLVGYNAIGFDFPFLNKRSIILRVKPSRVIRPIRYRSSPIYDPMQEWAGWNIKDTVKLGILGQVFGLGGKSGDGSQVYEMYQKGLLLEIAQYCFGDLHLTYGVYRRMMHDPGIIPQADIPVEWVEA